MEIKNKFIQIHLKGINNLMTKSKIILKKKLMYLAKILIIKSIKRNQIRVIKNIIKIKIINQRKIKINKCKIQHLMI